MSEVGLLLHRDDSKSKFAEDIYQQATEDCKSCGESFDSDNVECSENRIFEEKNEGSGESDVNGDEKKCKCRRRKKRKWVPYCKLSWDERCKVDERGSRRANRVRAEMQASGHALAPYNTTQFLMEDHREYDPLHVSCAGNVTSEQEDESCNCGADFLYEDFTKTYETIHAETLLSMDKCELVQELMDMEDKQEELRNKLKVAQEKQSNELTNCSAEKLLKIAVFREEIKKLSKENEFLKQENYCLSQFVKGA